MRCTALLPGACPGAGRCWLTLMLGPVPAVLPLVACVLADRQSLYRRTSIRSIGTAAIIAGRPQIVSLHFQYQGVPATLRAAKTPAASVPIDHQRVCPTRPHLDVTPTASYTTLQYSVEQPSSSQATKWSPESSSKRLEAYYNYSYCRGPRPTPSSPAWLPHPTSPCR